MVRGRHPAARRDKVVGSGVIAVVAVIGPSITDPSVGIGMIFDKNRYGLDNDTGEFGSRSLSTVPVNMNTVWLVTKLDFTTGNEYLWINPSIKTEPDIANADAQRRMTAEFQAAGFPFLRLRVGYTRALFQFDELRVATTFAEIVELFVPDAHGACIHTGLIGGTNPLEFALIGVLLHLAHFRA